MNLRISLVLIAVSLAGLPSASFAQSRDGMPVPVKVSGGEQQELAKRVAERFRQDVPSDAEYAEAGPYLRASSLTFAYAERRDTGSIALESSLYADAEAPLDAAASDPKAVLAGVQRALRRAGIDTRELSFARFEDEFVASSEGPLPPGVDPRKLGVLVGRAVRFQRAIDGVPIFGSELLAGALPDGRLGRLRYHAPQIDAGLVKEAAALRDAVRAQRWQAPDSLRGPDTQILEVEAGVGHSAFSTPGFRAAAVVRVLVRLSTGDRENPLQSTRYAYFDARGREVFFDMLPETPASESKFKQN